MLNHSPATGGYLWNQLGSHNTLTIYCLKATANQAQLMLQF